MLTDALQIELLKHSPTFRRQVSTGLLLVGLEQWKGVTARLSVLEGLAAKGALDDGQMIALSLSRAERVFLDVTLAKQGVTLGGKQSPMNPSGMGNFGGDSSTEIDRLIDQLFARADWTWTVADWLEQQATAQQTINGQILALLTEMAAAPSK